MLARSRTSKIISVSGRIEGMRCGKEKDERFSSITMLREMKVVLLHL
jgi:hypothetical protein